MGQHGKYWPLVRALAIWLLWLFPTVGAAQPSCSLALLLALDVSSSVDEAEYRLQRDGLAQALLDPDVLSAILSQTGPVAMAAYEWSGRRQSKDILDWTLLASEADVTAASVRIASAQRSYARFPTAMGFALGYGATKLRDAPRCERKVIDVSGDGITNDGFWPELAYKHFPFDDVTVNGLAVLGADPFVLEHYTEDVRRGAGSFVESSQGYDGFRDAMARKLLREIGTRVVGAVQ